MPTAIAYRRAPLVDPALVPLSDAAVHADGLQKQLTDLALGLVDLNRMSPLDAALATKLGGYTDTAPRPARIRRMRRRITRVCIALPPARARPTRWP